MMTGERKVYSEGVTFGEAIHFSAARIIEHSVITMSYVAIYLSKQPLHQRNLKKRVPVV